MLRVTEHNGYISERQPVDEVSCPDTVAELCFFGLAL
jgi:hypothetical protein